jgi:hypothetical protein
MASPGGVSSRFRAAFLLYGFGLCVVSLLALYVGDRNGLLEGLATGVAGAVILGLGLRLTVKRLGKAMTTSGTREGVSESD